MSIKVLLLPPPPPPPPSKQHQGAGVPGTLGAGHWGSLDGLCGKRTGLHMR